MTDIQHLGLLAAVLASQSEPEGFEPLTDERIRQALTTGPRLTADEKRLLWSSPDARAHFLTIRRQVRLDLSEAIASAGLGTSDMRLAASGSSSQDEVTGRGFTVSLFRDEAFEDEWSISVELSQEYLKFLPAETPVTLQDTGGLIWARGIPDVYNRIGATWQASETPQERLKRFTLRLEP
ncbi:hypothetical protein [Pannonibacter sp.]|uniref:hypothetical protein n=1 Tax=Pannonibacter sp. TaxID=1906786 RepID=UPI003F6F512D